MPGLLSRLTLGRQESHNVMFKSNLPVMTVDAQRYDAMLARGFERFPERHENYRQLTAGNWSAALPYKPGVLYVEPVGRCNFRCIMCDLPSLSDQKRGSDMPIETFKK